MLVVANEIGRLRLMAFTGQADLFTKWAFMPTGRGFSTGFAAVNYHTCTASSAFDSRHNSQAIQGLLIRRILPQSLSVW